MMVNVIIVENHTMLEMKFQRVIIRLVKQHVIASIETIISISIARISNVLISFVNHQHRAFDKKCRENVALNTNAVIHKFVYHLNFVLHKTI